VGHRRCLISLRPGRSTATASAPTAVTRKGVTSTAAVALVAAIGLASCSSAKASSSAAPVAPSASTIPGVPQITAPPPTPRASPTDAVSALLSAEQANNHIVSFGLLDAAGRAAYPLPTDWERRRTELAPITGFHVESAKGADVTVAVDHQPGIDPFVGLHFAHEHQSWTARKEGGGWLVDPDAKVVPVVPADAGAATTALAWGRAVQSCDVAAATRLQAIPTLLGTSGGPQALCHATGTLVAGVPAPPAQGPQTADLIAQYTVDVLAYVRQVHLGGIAVPFDTYLVPIGDAWQMVAVSG